MNDRNFYENWFRDGSEPDPMRAAQKGMKPELPRRFYTEAGVAEQEGLFVVALDGKPARTPARNLLGFSDRALAETVANEWQGQGEFINPARMPLTRIANSAIDGVSAMRQAVIEDIAGYAGSDLLCYRADTPAELVRRQSQTWDPVLEWCARTLESQLVKTTGVVHIPQAPEALTAIREAVRQYNDLALACLHVMTTLTGSVVLALAVAQGHLGVDDAWCAAHIDEDYQAELWGADTEASERRTIRRSEMDAAARLLALASTA